MIDEKRKLYRKVPDSELRRELKINPGDTNVKYVNIPSPVSTCTSSLKKSEILKNNNHNDERNSSNNDIQNDVPTAQLEAELALLDEEIGKLVYSVMFDLSCHLFVKTNSITLISLNYLIYHLNI